jgi:hypothetical protein
MDIRKEEFRPRLDQGGEEPASTAAMEYIAECFREVYRPPANGASLGAILLAAEFENILHKKGFTIVPDIPTSAMRSAWKRGWFRSFYDRYCAMLRVTWPRDTDAT